MFFYKIFKREGKHGGFDVILGLSKEDILQLSYRDDSNTAIHVSHAEAGEIRTLPSHRKYLQDQGLIPDNNSFHFTSISYEKHNTFRIDYNDALASQGNNITTPIPRNLLSPSQINTRFSPAEIFKKSAKRDASIFTSFKAGKF